MNPIDAPVPDSIDPTPRLPEADPGLRSRKKQRTRDDLIAAGYELFAARGFDGTTTAQVAEHADVSQRTLFRHFPTKEALLYGDMEDARFELRSALAARPGDAPVLLGVREAMLSLAENFERHRDRRLMQARFAAQHPSVSGYFRAVVQARWEREIIVAVAERLSVEPMIDPRPEVLAGAAMSAARIATRQWTASGGESDFTELTADALAAIADLGDLATV